MMGIWHFIPSRTQDVACLVVAFAICASVPCSIAGSPQDCTASGSGGDTSGCLWDAASLGLLQRSSLEKSVQRRARKPSPRVALVKFYADSECKNASGSEKNVSLSPNVCSMAWNYTCSCQGSSKVVVGRYYHHGCNSSASEFTDYIHPLGRCLSGNETASDPDVYAMVEDYHSCPCCGADCSADGSEEDVTSLRAVDSEANNIVAEHQLSGPTVLPPTDLIASDPGGPWAPYVLAVAFTDHTCQHNAFGIHEWWSASPDHCAGAFNVTCGCDGDTKVVVIEAHVPSCAQRDISYCWTWPTERCLWDPRGYGGQYHFAFFGHQCPSCPPPSGKPVCVPCHSCTVHGDPHITVFDQAEVALLGVGEPTRQGHAKLEDKNDAQYDVSGDTTLSWGDFWLVKSQDVLIQARYRKVYYPNAREPLRNTYLTAVAIGGPFMRGHTLLVEPRSGSVTWRPAGGADSTLLFQDDDVRGGSAVFERSELITVKYSNRTAIVPEHEDGSLVPGLDIELPSNVTVLIDRFQKHLDLRIDMLPSSGGRGGVDGQCGNFNGDPDDDTAELIEGRIGYQVPENELLFD